MYQTLENKYRSKYTERRSGVRVALYRKYGRVSCMGGGGRENMIDPKDRKMRWELAKCATDYFF